MVEGTTYPHLEAEKQVARGDCSQQAHDFSGEFFLEREDWSFASPRLRFSCLRCKKKSSFESNRCLSKTTGPSRALFSFVDRRVRKKPRQHFNTPGMKSCAVCSRSHISSALGIRVFLEEVCRAKVVWAVLPTAVSSPPPWVAMYAGRM